MKQTLRNLTIASCILSAVSIILYDKSNMGIFLSLTITFGTTFYHFAMRLVVGGVINHVMNNHADYHKKWYQPFSFEKGLYKKLKVKQWKGKMPSYDPSLFSVENKSFDEIAQAMCQAEIVHEVIIIFSFIPIMASKWFGALLVFIITSIGAAMFDMLFVIMQRYNRPRIVKLVEREKRRKSNK